MLQAGDVRPHRVRQWVHSPDPQFRHKVNAICALYRHPPKGSVVLSVDEKTGIQAIERKHADRAPLPGRARRREFEYIRHGTQAGWTSGRISRAWATWARPRLKRSSAMPSNWALPGVRLPLQDDGGTSSTWPGAAE